MSKKKLCPQDIQSRINELRIEKKIRSIYEIGKRAQLPDSTIQGLMSGHNLPALDTLFAICRGLNVTLDYFFEDFEDSPGYGNTQVPGSDEDFTALWTKLDNEGKDAVGSVLKLYIDRQKLPTNKTSK